MPEEGETGPALAYRIRLKEETVQKETEELKAAVRARRFPERWLITPDATPENIVSLLENGAGTVTLSACGSSRSLYESPGFRFYNIIMLLEQGAEKNFDSRGQRARWACLHAHLVTAARVTYPAALQRCKPDAPLLAAGLLNGRRAGARRGELFMYDVIIAGAGPAGCTAARHLAGQGKRVLLAEKCRLPRYKSCSGILIEKSMNLVRQYYGEAVPASVLCTPTDNRGMIFTDDQGREYRFEQKGLNVWRSFFDHWLASRAAAAGAEVREHTMVTECVRRKDCVSVMLRGEVTRREEARYFLDCEGAAGTLKRRLTGTDPGYITTFQTFNRGRIRLDPHYFYAYLQPELSEYDAWFNVKDEMLICGVAVREPAKIRPFYQSFLSFLEKRHELEITERLKEEKWLMPRILPGCPVTCGEGRILFAGETAGFLNPMGEGISAGMESGFLAADALLRHWELPEEVQGEYLYSLRPLRRYMERQWSFVAGMSDTFREMLLPGSPYGRRS